MMDFGKQKKTYNGVKHRSMNLNLNSKNSGKQKKTCNGVKHPSMNLNLNSENIENKKYPSNDIRSIEILKNDDDECDNDYLNNIDDVIGLPDISSFTRKEDKFYQHLLAVDDGIYDGTVNEKSLREGQGTFSINNGEEYYSGSWKNDKPNGYGFNLKNHGLIVYHGTFEDSILKEGYGKEQLSDDYEYKGEISNGSFHGLGTLSIKVSGLGDILKLVAEWKEGKAEIVYKNDIEEYYKKQNKVFHNALENLILLNNENHQKQREYFRTLIDLFEKRLSDLVLLKEITTNTILPSELKLSADLLFKLDNSYTNLEKYTKIDKKTNYNNCIHEICLKSLKIYARRLAWSDDENKNHFISDKNIFDNSLNDFLTKTQLSDFKKVLNIHPFVVDLIKKLIRFANGRAIQILSEYRTSFINYHVTFLQNLWNDYFKELKYDENSDTFVDKNDEKYHFYSDCYSNLIELSLLNEFEIEIESKILKVKHQNSSILVKCNVENVYHNTPNKKELKMIVLDGAIGSKISEQSFNIEGCGVINGIVEELSLNHIIVIILPHNKGKTLGRNIINFFQEKGSNKIDKLKENQTWICLMRGSDNIIYEEISCNSVQKLLVKENFQFKLDNEGTLVDKKTNKYDIESIFYKAMRFSLDNFKPWMNIEVDKWSDYLKIPIHQDISIKEIGNQLLIKILQDSKNYIVSFLQMNKDINTEYSNQIANQLESIINYYKYSLLKDKNFNYQSKMKEIRKILDYFLQISVSENSQNQVLTELQLKSIREFIEKKQSITEVIDHFLNFNIEFLKLSKIFSAKFPSHIHLEFHNNASKIISLIADIFKLIVQEEFVQPETEDARNHTDTLKKYKVSNLGVGLRNAIYEGNIIDVKVLLEAGADINEQDVDSKKTALHWAVIKKHKDIISYLLEKSANTQIKDKDNRSSVDYAKEIGIDLNSLNKFQNTLFAMQKLNNFLTNLASLDINWYVELKQIKDVDSSVFEKVGDKDIYKVLQINEGKPKLNDACPHYVLDAIIELLEIIKGVKIINQASSIEMIKLRAELIMAIGKSFKYFNDQIKYNSLAKFKEECVTPFKDVIIDNNSYETFFDKLEKLDLYFLYNRKLKEITLDQALELFQEKNETSLNIEKIRNSFVKYEELFRKYFNNIINRVGSVKDIVEETKKLAKESNFKRETIPDIIARLSVILSLRVSDFIEECYEEYILKEKCNTNYLLQPHCIQILGVMILLDIDGNTNSLPPNHLGEILTGQGKSWALALLGGYFSLIGYQVTVGCYSDYLSRRDENDFKKNLEPFRFQNSVQYQTFKAMCWKKVSNKNTNKDLANIISDIISGEKLSRIETKNFEEDKSILLIDEVDVFFSRQFGEMFHSVVTIKNKNIAQIQKDIWQFQITKKPDENELENFVDAKIFSLGNKDKMITNLLHANSLKKHIKEMIDTAREIYNDINEKNLFKEKFRIIDDIICAKDCDGKYSSTTILRYENSFYYLKLMYEKQNSFGGVSLNENNFGYILISCGDISYSELPNSFDGIFGVSGSLKDLSVAENSLLTHYKINQKSYYPSFFGQTKLKFDRINNFIIKDFEKDWCDHIVTSTRRRIAEERSVLIFFKNETLLDEFHKSCAGDLGVKPYFITQNKTFDGKEEKHYNDSDVKKLIKDEYAGHHGKVTLLTKEFGRGVDFQSETKVNEKGGIHVIQTFFSIDIKEEIQIKGRTARKDEQGSYELILCLEHLQQFNIEGGKILKYAGITKDTTYDELNSQREEKTNSFCQDKLKTIEKNQQIHSRTLAFYQRAITECTEENRVKLIQEIEQLRVLN
ncbi:unnamed protein product [Adineta steineri]|uniref:SecA family profile domain-containing protein n=1 Tax=Adineta steineri TaxID=433720 RepID=A0A815M4I7_9BILA|nr:unnamed protein product [Adineta steineri]CAF3766480.1 unnamed protein product [Adineta steineri]